MKYSTIEETPSKSVVRPIDAGRDLAWGQFYRVFDSRGEAFIVVRGGMASVTILDGGGGGSWAENGWEVTVPQRLKAVSLKFRVA
jgi:hypothetical protein